jgi:hypothetical protein
MKKELADYIRNCKGNGRSCGDLDDMGVGGKKNFSAEAVT